MKSKELLGQTVRRAGGANRLQLRFERCQSFTIRFDRFDETIESRVQVVIPLIREAGCELSGSVTNEIQIAFVW